MSTISYNYQKTTHILIGHNVMLTVTKSDILTEISADSATGLNTLVSPHRHLYSDKMFHSESSISSDLDRKHVNTILLMYCFV